LIGPGRVWCDYLCTFRTLLVSVAPCVPGSLSKVIEGCGMAEFGIRFGRLVREKRGIEGLSIDKLVSRCDLTKSQISNLENGKIRRPQAKTIDALCVALNITREERSECYGSSPPSLPPLLLENLAMRFGHENPNALEENLEAFLKQKAVEFREMQSRLAKLAAAEGRLSNLFGAANGALEGGDFETADKLLEEAELVQLQSMTIPALEKQVELRIERGNAALVGGNISGAIEHFKRAVRYFSGVDEPSELRTRDEYADLLRLYGYRYGNSSARYAAKAALEENSRILESKLTSHDWCKTKIALGGTSWRLSQFDKAENAASHLEDAKKHFEDVHKRCSETVEPYFFARALGSLANVYSEKLPSTSRNQYQKHLELSIEYNTSALKLTSKSETPQEWGILQHNLGHVYSDLAMLRRDKVLAVRDAESAIHHTELSFEVRDPRDSLQYWVASCRTLGEALLNRYLLGKRSAENEYLLRARTILTEAASNISANEHPHQWGEIQTQLARCDNLSAKRAPRA
jgi:transcriptional regulator with XRE-family HTH domain